MPVFEGFTRRSDKLPRVVLCESFDQRVLRAAHVLNQHKLAQVALLGSSDELDRLAVGYRVDLRGMEIHDFESDQMQKGIAAQLTGRNSSGDLDPMDPVVAGAWLVRTGRADAVVAGAATTPTHVMRVFLRLLGPAEDCQTVSGISLIAFEGFSTVRSPVVAVADVSVVPEPTVEQLADIAIQSSASYERMTGGDPRVAFLSFSTHGSSEHPAAQRVRDAVNLTRSRKPELVVDGEMQIDAALIPAVAGAKSSTSVVSGNANVLIFPSLDAGNTAVKIFGAFTNCRVIGPVLQGMRYRGTYIPRASASEDIVDQVRLLMC